MSNAASAGKRPPGSTPIYPHLQDLLARVQPSQHDHASISGWMNAAETHWRQYLFAKENTKALDRIYVEYMMTFTIISAMIPSHREYTTFKAEGGMGHEKYRKLSKDVMSHSNYIGSVKDQIKANNEATGVQSAAALVNGSSQGHSRSSSVPSAQTNGRNGPPPVAPKPLSLSSKPLNPKKAPPPGLRNGTGHSVKSSVDWSLRLETLKPGTPSIKSPVDTPSSLMNGYGGSQSTLSLNLDNSIKPPSPTYSPARGLPPSATFSSLTPSTPGTGRRYDHIPVPNVPPPSVPIDITQEKTLTADELYGYIAGNHGNISILLVDIRFREPYDSGHVAGDSVCIEPIVMHEGISGADIEERAFLFSNDQTEQSRFEKRNTYDLVVFYDQSSKALEKSAPNQQFVRAVVDFSYSKRLKHNPLFLIGGFDSWVQLVGPRSSMIAKSSSYMRVDEEKQPNGTGHEGGVIMSDDPEAIDLEKESAWLNRVKSGELTINIPNNETDVKRQRRAVSILPVGEINRNIEDFMSRFPASPIFQQSMTSQTPTTAGSAISPRHNPVTHQPYFPFTELSNSPYQAPPSPTRPPPAVPRKSYSGISEKLSPLGTLDQPPARPPKIQPSGSFSTASGSGNDSIGRVGLKNLGNTCYMNSIVQCLSGTVPFARYFLDGSYKPHVNVANPLGSRGVLTKAYSQVITDLWHGQARFVSPATFREVVGRLNETFRTSDQQDALEFLEFLLDGLHEDLNTNALARKFKELTEQEELNREKLPIQVASDTEWRRYIHTNLSVVVFWFQGQLASRLTCLTCQTTSTTYNTFSYLSVPIPRKARCTLKECIEEFLKEEIMEKDDAWHCPTCKKPRKATKKLIITRLPSILIIHLKRFTNKGMWRDKLNTAVEYPLRNMDLTPYVPALTPALQNGDKKWKPDEQWKGQQTPPFLYDMHAVCNHYGTLNGGHYTAFVNNPYQDVWNCHDDSNSSYIGEEDVIAKSAYVLFFKRKDIM